MAVTRNILSVFARMNLIIPYIVFMAVSFWGGYFTAHRLDLADLQELRFQIQSAEQAHRAELAKVQEQERQTAVQNSQMEESHAKAVADLQRQYNAFRLRTTKPAAPKTGVSAGTNTKEPADTTAERTLSGSFAEFLGREAFRADLLRLYASECHKFVVENRCGVSQ